jgi:lipid II isoglutaminyl synthase (glutamine-hydrolysing)
VAHTIAAPGLPEPLPARTRLAAGLGTAVAGLSRRLGRGSGSVVGGRVILAVDPNALSRLAAGHRVGLISGTNGKTTTTSLVTAALGTVGTVATNAQGANLPPGVAAALAVAEPSATAALEVDEAWLGHVVAAVRPGAVALLNLSRDQLDRNNEVRRLASSWRRSLAGLEHTTVVANADDPLVVWGAGSAHDVRWVGAGQPWTLDASGCPACGARIRFAPDGSWHCGSCAFSRPTLDVQVDEKAVFMDGQRIELRLSLPGRANRANAAMALTLARALGADLGPASEAIADVAEVVGRYALVRVGTCEARLLLAKNPAGWLEIFDVLRPSPIPVVVAINAHVADGKDPSWLWDVPFERLAGRMVVATGERSRDLAVRLRYAGVEHRHERDPLTAITVAGATSVDVVANYTSFQALRARLR